MADEQIHTFLNVHGIKPLKIKEDNDAVQYGCNMAFSKVFDTSVNNKFPGSAVVSLSRSMLLEIQGLQSQHIPYTLAELTSWCAPFVRHIPPCKFKNSKDSYTLNPSVNTSHSIVRINSSILDFGPDDGSFHIVIPIFVDIGKLDFGKLDDLCEFKFEEPVWR